MFESVSTATPAANLRAAALPPAAATGFTLLSLTAFPFLGQVPLLLFWIVVTVLLAGAVWGGALLIRVVRRERLRGLALGWLAGAVVIELICARLLLWFTLPWL